MTKLQVNQILFSQHFRVYFSSNRYRAPSPRETRVAMFVFSCKVCYNQALANMVSTRLTFVIKLQMVSSRVYVFRRKNSVLFFIFLKDCKNILIFPNTYVYIVYRFVCFEFLRSNTLYYLNQSERHFSSKNFMRPMIMRHFSHVVFPSGWKISHNARGGECFILKRHAHTYGKCLT